MGLTEICIQAKQVKHEIAALTTGRKNEALLAVANGLELDTQYLLKENKKDIEQGEKNQMPAGLIDRLLLTEDRIQQIAEGLKQLVVLEDPIGEVLSMKKRPNGLLIGQKRVPLGVIGIIYESRPNVTADAFGLCFKTGNVVILRGGSDAIHSNKALVFSIQKALRSCNINPYTVQLIEDTSRETAKEFMHMNEYVDVLIPRGGAGLISTVVNTATIPVIETGIGNCHVYVDEFADLSMAINILVNAKTQRIGVCNTCESVLIHEKVAEKFVPMMEEGFKSTSVEIRGDQMIAQYSLPDYPVVQATDEDYRKEFLDYIISAKVVNSLDEAINHINHYNTGHSETIVTQNYNHAQQFLDQIDAAAVYVNASTRFTDGFEFGFGAEIGISTQKLHARGPMGLLALTSTKYIIYGDGQIRV